MMDEPIILPIDIPRRDCLVFVDPINSFSVFIGCIALLATVFAFAIVFAILSKDFFTELIHFPAPLILPTALLNPFAIFVARLIAAAARLASSAPISAFTRVRICLSYCFFAAATSANSLATASYSGSYSVNPLDANSPRVSFNRFICSLNVFAVREFMKESSSFNDLPAFHALTPSPSTTSLKFLYCATSSPKVALIASGSYPIDSAET